MATAARNDIKESSLDVHQRDRHAQPLNAEVKPDQLVESFITPTNKIFHRNHDEIPRIPLSHAVEYEWKVVLSVEPGVIEHVETHTREDDAGSWTASWKANQDSAVTLVYGDLLHSTGSCTGVEQISTTATLECAGNRRQDLADAAEPAEGLQWAAGAISTASWSGPSIRSLLLHNGIGDPYASAIKKASSDLQLSQLEQDCATWAGSLHVHMRSVQIAASLSDAPLGDERFGASIPLAVAMHPRQQCILATAHNGQPLSEKHGFPVRAVLPGHVGARWVKWLSGLRISTRVDDSPPMRLDYKILTPPTSQDASEKEKAQWRRDILGSDDAGGNGQPDLTKRKAELQRHPELQSLGIGSAIEVPSASETLPNDVIDVRGYAVGQDGSPVSKVEVILLKQHSSDNDDESMTNLRERAAALDASQWTQANVQGYTADTASRRSVSLDDPNALSWAWSLWHAQVPWPEEQGDVAKTSGYYALIARAVTATGQQQEQESPWNARGFSTRSWPVVKNLQRRAKQQ